MHKEDINIQIKVLKQVLQLNDAAERLKYIQGLMVELKHPKKHLLEELSNEIFELSHKIENLELNTR